MKERGMIFNGEMVRAILDGRKTQTRRIIKQRHLFKPVRGFGFEPDSLNYPVHMPAGAEGEEAIAWAKDNCPHGKPGDRIWGRETWTPESVDAEEGRYAPDYRAMANGQPVDGKWRPSIHMPRWASRILLEITNVRVERLNDISEEDAADEGVGQLRGGFWKHYQPGWTQHQLSARGSFVTLWKSIYGEESWRANPWVWVIEFKRIEGEHKNG